MITNTLIENWQNDLYTKLNNYSQKHTKIGRCLSVPIAVCVAACDVLLDTCKIISVIEFVALAAINLVEAMFSKDYTLRKALIFAEMACRVTATFPIYIAFMPIKIIHQIIVIIINPETAKSISSPLKAEDLEISPALSKAINKNPPIVDNSDENDLP